jgi:hypothetical protein
MPRTRRKDSNPQVGAYACLTAGSEDPTPKSFYSCMSTTFKDCAGAAKKTAGDIATDLGEFTVKKTFSIAAKSAACTTASHLCPGMQPALLCNGIVTVTGHITGLMQRFSGNVINIESQRARAATESSTDDEKFEQGEAPEQMRMD